jgi:DNA (cytosine-5)-methyltransferase 1
MKLISLFSGIGGFELAAEWMGWQTALSCEINPFSRKVLEYYWPNAYHHDDIHTLNIDKINEELSKRYGANWADDDLILTGGFPCQPYSTAGKRLGKADERHLFPEMLRIVREVRPRYIVGENVRGLVSWSGGLVFEEVCADLEAEGYDVQPFILPACAVNAPHRRERVWFIANANERTEKSPREGGQAKSNGRKNNDEPSGGGEQTEQHFGRGNVLRLAAHANRGGLEGAEKVGRNSFDVERKGELGLASNADHQGLQGSEDKRISSGSGEKRDKQPSRFIRSDWENFPTQPPICGGDDRLPSELVGITFPKWRNESIKAYGNAIVPQVALEIFKTIENYIVQSKNNCSFEK